MNNTDTAPTTDAPLKLNIGAGDYPMDGYINIDRKNGDEAYPLDYPDATFDEVRASHILEHFPFTMTVDVMREWLRVLKPGGIIKIAVPDFEAIATMMLDRHPIFGEGYIMGGHTDEDDRHGAIFTRAKLAELFHVLGLEDARIWAHEPGNEDTAGCPVSLNFQARKPSMEKGATAFDGVYFVLPSPRFGPAEHHRCIYDTLALLKAKVNMVMGCFWNQHLSNAMEDVIANPDCRYVVTLDYDSIFSPDDVAEMYRIMETHPHIDALVPMQSHRGADTPLFTIQDRNGRNVKTMAAEIFEGITTEISTGHFGLTFIRADKLREFPRPWMHARLAPDNTWGEGHVDADIDFWYKWRAHGNRVDLACNVIIGHLQDYILWPGKDLAPITQKVTDYMKHGKPPEAK